MMMVKKYIILNAPPLFIPGSKIGTIVTSIRKISHTNRNLVGNNIKYNDLVMLDLPNMEARQRQQSRRP
jgi:hypothetical protein